MTTFALVAGMMPVAIGIGEGGEFYRPMALAIIGGVMVSTFLTLLVTPSIYDSIEINRERAKLKFKARAALYHPLPAFVLTFCEALVTLIPLRFLYRLLWWTATGFKARTPVEHPVERAARLRGFPIPAGYKPRPQAWQRPLRTPAEVLEGTPASPAPPKTEPPVLEPIGSA
jgi:hypothetical protein